MAKVACEAKGLGQVIATFEGILEKPTPNTEGGMYYLNAACRDAGSSRNGDHVLRAISASFFQVKPLNYFT